MAEDIVDFLVIGAGPSGAASTWSLADTGTRIMCMEQGDWMKQKDYPSNFRNWERLLNTEMSISPNVRELKSDYPINDTENSPISIANFNAVGGSSILYAAHFPRFHPFDFKVKTLDGVADDWPIDYFQLEKFYDLNDRIIGVSGLVGDPAYPPKKARLPPIPMGEMGNIMARAFNKLGWHWWPPDVAIISEAYNGRDKCINLGPCVSGCTQGAKSTADVTYWPIALRKKGVELKTNCRVREITINNDGLANGVIYYNEEGTECRQRAEVVIIACNGVGTPRLLLNSISKHFPDGLANRSGYVGKNLMLHPWGRVEGFFDQDLKSHLGPVGCCISSQEFCDTNTNRNFLRGFGLQMNRGTPPVATAQEGLINDDIHLGKNHHEEFKKYFGSKISCHICFEDLPEINNSVTIDPELKDSNGIPAPKINYDISENSKKMISYGIDRGRELMEAAGARKIYSEAPMRMAGWHLMGTARMGKNPEESVVNEWGRSHDVKNLFIVDASLFVTSASVNPTSTIQALALYISDHIKNNISNLFD